LNFAFCNVFRIEDFKTEREHLSIVFALRNNKGLGTVFVPGFEFDRAEIV
jgi:hypothetical protein